MSANELDEMLVSIHARLSMHEYLLEILYANWMAGFDDDEAKQACAEVVRRSRQPYTSRDVDPAEADRLLRTAQEMTAMLDRLLEKALSRAGELRKARFEETE